MQKSVDYREKVGWVFEKSQVMFQLGVAPQEKGGRHGANEQFSKALGTFDRMGAKLDIERVLARRELIGA